MIKVDDKVRYIGTNTSHVGRSGGTVARMSDSGWALVAWPGLPELVCHLHESLVVTLSATSPEPAVGHEDGVRKPSHYQVFDGLESIEVIARSMTVSEFRGFCMGNVLKYRLRAGKKSELATMEKDLSKAAFYQELFDLHKAKCYDAK